MLPGRFPLRRSSRRWLHIACGLLASASTRPAVALAQGSDGMPEAGDVSPQRATMPCNGETIREIVIFSSAPTVAGLRRFPLVADIARAAHSTTVPSVVRGFLLFREG